jgi:hypothetical protein
MSLAAGQEAWVRNTAENRNDLRPIMGTKVTIIRSEYVVNNAARPYVDFIDFRGETHWGWWADRFEVVS